MASKASSSARVPKVCPGGGHQAERFQRSLESVQPKIKEILEKCDGEPNVGQFCLDHPFQEIKHMCIGAGLTYRRPIFGRYCGVHPGSRAGAGLDFVHAQNLALMISFRRFSVRELDEPICFEAAGTETAESAKRRDLQLEFNARTFAKAEGYLRTIPHYDLMYLPVTHSHTFAALNIIEGGCKGLHKELTGGDGNIDRQKVLELRPSWKKPMQKGIRCIVFRRELEEACPQLPAFLSRAGNQHLGSLDFSKGVVKGYIDAQREYFPGVGLTAESELHLATDDEEEEPIPPREILRQYYDYENAFAVMGYT